MSRVQASLLGNRLGDLQHFAKQIVPDAPDIIVTSGNLTYKSNRKRDVAFPRSGSVTWLPPDDLFHLFF